MKKRIGTLDEFINEKNNILNEFWVSDQYDLTDLKNKNSLIKFLKTNKIDYIYDDSDDTIAIDTDDKNNLDDKTAKTLEKLLDGAKTLNESSIN